MAWWPTRSIPQKTLFHAHACWLLSGTDYFAELERNREQAGWESLVRRHLTARAVSSPGLAAYVLNLWQTYLESGLAHEHFVRELPKGEEGAFMQPIWEMMLGRHLLPCGYDVVSPLEEGRPDFRCEKQGRVLWVEATCITEGQDESLASHADWRCSSGYVPHDNILIRWASSLHAKIKQAEIHRGAGVIRPRESYVIAINGGAIATGNYGYGLSQLPYVVECTLAVGGLQFVYDRRTLALKQVAHQIRTHVVKSNKSPVPTAVFFDQTHAGIAALIGCGSLRVEGASLELLVAHNPHAESPLPSGVLGCDTREWAARLTRRDDEMSDWKIEQIFGSDSH